LPAAKKYRVIELIKDQVVTGESIYHTEAEYDDEPPAIELIGHNLVKLAVVERHHKTGNVGLALLRNFGLRRGAIATSIGHDAHNIIVAGVGAKDMELAVREIEKMQGGLVIVVNGKVEASLALPVAGLMAVKSVKEVANCLDKMREIANNLGVSRDGPFMTLSFMALPVIPSLKITDQGLFDIDENRFVSLGVDK